MRLPSLVLLALVPLLPACSTVESEKPLSPPAAALPDKRLEGIWRQDGTPPSYVYITYGPGGRGSMLSFGRDDQGIESTTCNFFVTRTPQGQYLNLSNRVYVLHGHIHRDHPGTYTFDAYHLSWWGGQLTIGTLDGPGFSAAVAQHKLRGVSIVDKKGNTTDTLLRDSSERILNFIESSKPADMVGTSETMRKLGGP
jgi:hypothetical protein